MLENTPYSRAKQIWDQRTELFALSAHHWRNIALLSIAFAIFMLIALIISLLIYKPKLYVAEVSPEGQVLNVKLMKENYQADEAQEEYFIVQFIKLVRGLPLDPVAAKSNWLNAYALLSDRGSQILNHYFEKNNPLTDLGKKSITININDISQLSKNSYHVDWTEENVDQNGQVASQQEMNGVFTVVIQQPDNKKDILQNPLGIYITDFNISHRLNN